MKTKDFKSDFMKSVEGMKNLKYTEVVEGYDHILKF